MNGARVNRAFFVLVHYRVWVATMVLALGAFTSRSLGITLDSRALGILWASTLFVYAADHVFDVREASTRYELGVAICGGLLLAGLLFTVPSLVLVVVFGGMLSIFGYLLAPRARTRKRSFSRALVKPLFIGAAVGIAVTLVPALVFGGENRGWWSKGKILEVFARAVVLGFLCSANSLFCDVFDEEVDRARGEATVAVLSGHRLARWIATGLVVVVVVATHLAYAFGWTRHFDARMSVSIAAIATVAVGCFLPKTTPKATASFLLDGALLLPVALGLFLVT